MSKKKATAICLPMSRTARIMNSAIGVDCVNQDIVALATKATEIFIQDLTRKAYELSDDDSHAITYDDIQRLVHEEPQYDFLVDWIPKRIKYSEALRMYEETEYINNARTRENQIEGTAQQEVSEQNSRPNEDQGEEEDNSKLENDRYELDSEQSKNNDVLNNKAD